MDEQEHQDISHSLSDPGALIRMNQPQEHETGECFVTVECMSNARDIEDQWGDRRNGGKQVHHWHRSGNAHGHDHDVLV